MTVLEKELESRKNTIKKELAFVFKANMKFTDWDVAEVDNHKAAVMLQAIFQEKLDEIKQEIESGKYD